MKPGELYEGKISWFGGPLDLPLLGRDGKWHGGVKWDEGLALFEPSQIAERPELFLTAQEAFDATPVDRRKDIAMLGLARRLNPKVMYCAMRWNYDITPKDILRQSLVECWPLTHPDRRIDLRPADAGPAQDTERLIDVSFGALQAMGVTTDDVVACRLIVPDDSRAWSISG